MKIVFASAAGGWQRRVLDAQGATNRLESYYYAKDKQFEVMFDEIRSRGGEQYAKMAQAAERDWCR